MMLITDVLFGAGATAIVTAVTAVTFALLWYAIPLRRLARR